MIRHHKYSIGLCFILLTSITIYTILFPYLGDLFTELVFIFERKLALYTTLLLIELLPELIKEIIYKIVCDLIV